MDANGVLARAYDETTGALRIAAGRELAYAESTSTQTGISTTYTDVTGLSITFTVGARPVYVVVDLAFLYPSSATAVALAAITDASGNAKAYRYVALDSTTITGRYAIIRERINTPGTYTRKVQIKRFAGSGTINVNLDATTLSTISAYEA